MVLFNLYKNIDNVYCVRNLVFIMIMSRIIVYEGFLEWYLCIIFVMYKEWFIEEIDVYV